MIRTVPNNGLILNNANDNNLSDTLDKGCWTPIQQVGKTKISNNAWQAELNNNQHGLQDGSNFNVIFEGQNQGAIHWPLTGQHNVNNALMAIGAARHAGIDISTSIDALNRFKTPKRRMELRSNTHDVFVYDDFAHHPTAIKTTLEGLRNQVGSQRIIAILEPRSNTMKMGIHKDTLAASWQDADLVFIHQNDVQWRIEDEDAIIADTVEKIVKDVIDLCQPSDHIVVMSNGSFANIHQQLIDGVDQKFSS